MNALLFYPRLSAEVVSEVDADQRARGMAARARGENPVYAQQIARPLRTFIIPNGHSRESRPHLFLEALKDPLMPNLPI